MRLVDSCLNAPTPASSDARSNVAPPANPNPNPSPNPDLLLDRLASGDLDIRALSAAIGLPLRDLAHWMNQRDNAATVDGLLRLADARMQMLLSRYRAAAATVLLHIASDKQPTDLVRKACVDLLAIKSNGSTANASAAERDGPRNAAAPAPPSEDAILKALQAIGEHSVD